MNLLGATILFGVLVTVFTAPRKWALVAVMVGILYLTEGQQVEVFGFNIFAVRFIELAGFVRVIGRREFTFSQLVRLDKLVLLVYTYTTVVFCVRSADGQAFQIGAAVDAFLCYFTFRGLLGGIEDFKWFLRSLVILLVPYVLLLLVDVVTRYNPFTSMGGIEYGDWAREGRLRCQGSFRHPSLLGTLGASFFPLYIGLAFSKLNRTRAVMGAGLCLAIVWASNSGGPASCIAVGCVGWALWRMRSRMRAVQIAVVSVFVGLALVMKAPVWYLLARVSSVTGGDGWHRAHLMDMAYQNLDKWWLAGMPILATHDWFPYVLSNTGGADMTNQFLAFGITAGIVAMLLFIMMLVEAFKAISRTLSLLRAGTPSAEPEEFFLWGIGVTLVVHIFNWLGISYFDQTYAIWFLQLAAVANATDPFLRSAKTYSNNPMTESASRLRIPADGAHFGRG